jgi:hypothetical protein
MKRSLTAFLMLVALGLGTAFVASAVFSTQSVANDSSAPSR